MSEASFLVQDNDCHWFIVPEYFLSDFRDWVYTQEHCEDWYGIDYNTYRVDGPHKVAILIYRVDD